MKIRLIILGLLIAVAVPVFAQLDTVRSNKNEFSIGYGFFPASSFRFKPGCMIYPESDGIGATFVTYTRRLTKVFGIGVTVCYDPIRLNYYDQIGNERALICKVNENSLSIIPHIKINWLNTKYVNLYSKAGYMGINYVTYKQEEFYPDLYEVNAPQITPTLNAFQITPIGIEVGTKRCAGFAQYGIGMEGCICVGFRYGLKDKE